MPEVVIIQKLVHGGQGLATLASGKKVFVWNSLPDEEVEVELSKNKKDFAEGLAVKVIKPSKHRISPLEPESYLSTSPWQIINFPAENNFKKQIIVETFAREKVSLPDFDFYHDSSDFYYRNKMEYSFFGDENGLHLALHARGSHRKIILTGSKLANPAIDQAGAILVKVLQALNVRASDLKSVILRTNQKSEVVAGLLVKTENFAAISDVKDAFRGLSVYYSNPKSPASVPTKLLQSVGSQVLEDKLLGKNFKYDALSFFQGNLPVYEVALSDIKNQTNELRLGRARRSRVLSPTFL